MAVVDVRLGYENRLIINPDTIRVPWSEEVAWHVHMPVLKSALDLEIYFPGSTPFSWSKETIRLLSRHENVVVAVRGVAEHRGTHKYGVKAQSLDAQIDDEVDPYLICE